MEYTCKICNSKDSSDEWIDGEQMLEEKLCFTCWFWNNNLIADKNRKYAVIKGEHYVLESHTDSYFKGFGGSKFYIKFNDGHIEFCDNLWYQGEIPQEWKEKFPDNAEFITKEEFERSQNK